MKRRQSQGKGEEGRKKKKEEEKQKIRMNECKSGGGGGGRSGSVAGRLGSEVEEALSAVFQPKTRMSMMAVQFHYRP
ncbi:hypothetical protein SUGI_0105170 [Cryptomeria japonica]|nr:hypothetical protein SUGI_0105170 [Cryptomeria japonica]